MGTYTKLGVNMVVVDKYRRLVADMLDAYRNPPHPRWEHLLDSVFQAESDGIMYFNGSGAPPDSPLLQGLKLFVPIDRSGWVGFSKLSDHTNSYNWGDVNKYDPNTGRWIFTCSLKNVGNVIEAFLDKVLPHLASEISNIQVEIDPCGGRRCISNYALEEGKIVHKGYVQDPSATVDESVNLWGQGDSYDYENLAPAEEFQ